MKLDICLVVCDVFALEVLSIQQIRELSARPDDPRKKSAISVS